ncbi:hypothetical protein LC653_29275 [Nostoc sp. CHAB 5784]|uniref:hypothetical protein n=1 Tax=Nostoc mirabile TaxID=2907820 RepID=UPI001E507DF0|nr:hypothetical protein [Nostoc mirabile]MCC5667860.1 hypothetical protein [Nostoc mirabile CHAB5784]
MLSAFRFVNPSGLCLGSDVYDGLRLRILNAKLNQQLEFARDAIAIESCSK